MDTAIDGSTLRGSLAEQVGARIRRLRKQRNMTLEQLGKLCGTSPQSAQRFESANMTLSLLWLERVAKALGVEPYELLADNCMAEARKTARQDLVRLFCQTVEAAYGEEEELRR
jgi:transcriptional regulator with XRE-family HTH domain